MKLRCWKGLGLLGKASVPVMVGQAHRPILSSRALVSFPVVQGVRLHLRCDGDGRGRGDDGQDDASKYHFLKRGRNGFQKHRGYPEGDTLDLSDSP